MLFTFKLSLPQAILTILFIIFYLTIATNFSSANYSCGSGDTWCPEQKYICQDKICVEVYYGYTGDNQCDGYGMDEKCKQGRNVCIGETCVSDEYNINPGATQCDGPGLDEKCKPKFQCIDQQCFHAPGDFQGESECDGELINDRCRFLYVCQNERCVFYGPMGFFSSNSECDGPGRDEKCSKKFICKDEKCVKAGIYYIGPNECAYDGDNEPCKKKYYCQGGEKCTYGFNKFNEKLCPNMTDNECQDEPKHYVCLFESCVGFPGSGDNACNGPGDNESCKDKYICQNETCTISPDSPNGTSECSGPGDNEPCKKKFTCVGLHCAYSNEGSKECSSDSECQRGDYGCTSDSSCEMVPWDSTSKSCTEYTDCNEGSDDYFSKSDVWGNFISAFSSIKNIWLKVFPASMFEWLYPR